MPQVASETPSVSRTLPPAPASAPRASQAKGDGSPFESLLDDSVPPSPAQDQASAPQAASEDAAPSQPPAQQTQGQSQSQGQGQTQADSTPAQPPGAPKAKPPAGKKSADSGKTDGKGTTDPKVDAKADSKTDLKAKDAPKTASTDKTDGAVKLAPVPPEEGKKKADKTDKAEKDKAAKSDGDSKDAKDAATSATPAAPDPAAAQQAHANAQGQASANVAAAAAVVAVPQAAAPADGAATDGDKKSSKAKTPVLGAVTDVDKTDGAAAKQGVQSGQPGQAAQPTTPQAQASGPQVVAPETAGGKTQAAPAPDSDQKTADRKAVADARGQKSDGHRFTLPDPSANATSNTQSTPAQSASNAAQTLNVPTQTTQPTQQTAAAAAAAAAPQTPAAAPVPLAGVAVAITARAREGKNDFSIRLDPPDLGRVDVKISVDKDGHITSHLMADRKDTLQLLQRDSSGLQRALQDAGFKTADNGLQYSLRDSGQQQQQQQQQQQSNSNGAGHIVLEDGTTATAAIPNGYGRYLGRAGGLDIRV